MIKNNLKEKNRGFTIVETLVAIAILLVSVTGPMAFSRTGLVSLEIYEDRAKALSLAREGLEAVKNIRDNNNLTGAPWLDGLNSCNGALKCSIDTTIIPFDVDLCDPSGCDPLLQDEVAGIVKYGHTGEPSKFTRTITVREKTLSDETGPVSNEAIVTVTVEWVSSNLIPKEVVLEEFIYSWNVGGWVN